MNKFAGRFGNVARLQPHTLKHAPGKTLAFIHDSVPIIAIAFDLTTGRIGIEDVGRLAEG